MTKQMANDFGLVELAPSRDATLSAGYYTVQVTDQDGSFYVWARNLDRALALQAKQGTSLAFNLRNYEVDFVKLQQQVDSSDDSKYRIELLTPAEFSFALKLSSIAFQPQMLTANDNFETQNLREVA